LSIYIPEIVVLLDPLVNVISPVKKDIPEAAEESGFIPAPNICSSLLILS